MATTRPVLALLGEGEPFERQPVYARRLRRYRCLTEHPHMGTPKTLRQTEEPRGEEEIAARLVVLRPNTNICCRRSGCSFARSCAPVACQKG